MTMGSVFPAGSWRRKRPEKNGWILLDVLLALSLSALTLTALLPLAVQVAFLLKEKRSGLSRPVQFAVWPLNEGEL